MIKYSVGQRNMISWSLIVHSLVIVQIARTSGSTGSVRYRFQEEIVAGTEVANIKADSNLWSNFNDTVLSQLSFVILRQTGNREYLTLESTSGVVRTAMVIDRDRICPGLVECVISIDVAVRPSSYFQTIKLDFEVLDLNDNSPQFPKPQMHTYISEGARPGTVIRIPSAMDPDSPMNGVSQYSIQSSSEKFNLRVDKTDDGAFELGLVLSETIDREEQDRYVVNVTASDGNRTGSVLVEIRVNDINDHRPTFEKRQYGMEVSENSPPRKSFLRVRATDADSGANGKVSYSFSSKSISQYGHLFSIDRDSGWISLVNNLDFEKQKLILLEVYAHDGGEGLPPDDATVVIQVKDANDNAPQIRFDPSPNETQGYLGVVEQAANNTPIVTVSVYDPDTGDGGAVQCSLLQTDGSTPDDFRLVQIYETEYTIVVSTNQLDRERIERYHLQLTCQDGGRPPLYSSESLVIYVEDINDNGPEFSQPIYNVSIAENTHELEILVKVTATDRDKGMNADVVYNLHPDTDQMFGIDMHSGAIWSKVVLDREKQAVHRFQVVASDRGPHSTLTTSQVVIHILDENDEAPKFNQTRYDFSISENLPARTEVGRLTAVDPDAHPNNECSFHLDSLKSPMGLFSIDPHTGVITTKHPLDRETDPVHLLTVIVKDAYRPDLQDVVTVTVRVSDVNDNFPVISYPTEDNDTVHILSSIWPGETVATVSALDQDFGNNGQLTYSIAQGNELDKFSMETKTGRISVKSSLAEYDMAEFSLRLTVSDLGTPAKSSHCQLRVIVSKILVQSSAMNVNHGSSDLDRGSLLAIVISGALIFLSISGAAIFVGIFVWHRRKRMLKRRDMDSTFGQVISRTDGEKATEIILNRESIRPEAIDGDEAEVIVNRSASEDRIITQHPPFRPDFLSPMVDRRNHVFDFNEQDIQFFGRPCSGCFSQTMADQNAQIAKVPVTFDQDWSNLQSNFRLPRISNWNPSKADNRNWSPEFNRNEYGRGAMEGSRGGREGSTSIGGSRDRDVSEGWQLYDNTYLKKNVHFDDGMGDLQRDLHRSLFDHGPIFSGTHSMERYKRRRLADQLSSNNSLEKPNRLVP